MNWLDLISHLKDSGVNPYYEDDSTFIINADCRDILPLIPCKSIDLLLTDPPYEISGMGGGGFAGHQFYQNATGIREMITFDDYNPELARIADELVVFHSRLQINKWAEFCWKYFGNYDLHFWYKPNAIPFTHNTWKSDVEYIALGWREKTHVKVSQEQKSKVFIHPIETENLHPAQKPLSLMQKYILILGAQVILDPYCGGGTTLRAAKNLSRKCIGIEIEEAYCEIAAKRLSQMVLPLKVETSKVEDSQSELGTCKQ